MERVFNEVLEYCSWNKEAVEELIDMLSNWLDSDEEECDEDEYEEE